VGKQFDSVTLDWLRERKSEKWATYPRDVLPAFVAEMDFALAPAVRDAVRGALELGDFGYASTATIPPAFVYFAQKRFGWDVDERAVFAIPDVMAGVTEALHALTCPGASVVINPPVYPPFFDVIAHADRTVVEVPLLRDAELHWSIDFDALERAFSQGAQAYLLCSPHNPVGRVWSRAELEEIAMLAARHRVAVISDEIHAPLTMPGVTFVPFLSIAHDQPSVAITSASKAWNIGGLKCAVMIAGPASRDALAARLKSRPNEIEWRTGHLGVLASVAAFRDGAAWLDDLLGYLDSNRRLLTALLRDHIPSARYSPPDATFLAWIDCTDLHLEGDPARRFLERGRVALEAGAKFGRASGDWVRLNLGTSRAILHEIVSRMATALD
jgi:cystathionine beta-lyase